MNTFIMPAQPNEKAIQKETKSLLDRTSKFTIDCEDGFVASWSYIEAHDKAIKRVEEMFDPFVSGMHKMHKMACELRNTFLLPLTSSKRLLLEKRAEYRSEQERLQAIENEKKAEALRKQEQRDLEQQAKVLAKTDKEAAAALREEAKNVPLPVIAPTAAVPQQAGSYTTTRWLFEIDDPEAVERLYCSPDEQKIRKIVDALGDKANITGVRVWKEKKEHSRTVS